MKNRRKIVVVCGPTATGKSALALQLAHAFSGEMLGADSMQIYNGLVIGTAALTPNETEGVPQHLVGFLPPEESFSVAQYVQEAHGIIEGISARGRLPIVCGGTGLYIESLVNGISFTPNDASPALRAQLQREWEEKGAKKMLQELTEVDPEAATRLHPNDQTRILRALEQAKLTGTTKTQRARASQPKEKPYDALCIGLACRERTQLYRRIEERIDAMVNAGLLDEARRVFDNRTQYKTAVQAIGYKEFFPFFEKEKTLDACVEILKQATRNYAKRQLTWFRRMPEMYWLAPEDADCFEQAQRLVADFLEKES